MQSANPDSWDLGAFARNNGGTAIAAGHHTSIHLIFSNMIALIHPMFAAIGLLPACLLLGGGPGGVVPIFIVAKIAGK
jgi:hypothetical protein